MSDETRAKVERIAAAINKKFPKHMRYIREIKTGDFSFFEIALRPENGTHINEVTTAYSSDFFAEVTDENILPKAKRILNDFRILMGLPVE